MAGRELNMKIKNILFPVDFSDRCGAVVPHVEAAARRFGSAVSMLPMAQLLCARPRSVRRAPAVCVPGTSPACWQETCQKDQWPPAERLLWTGHGGRGI